MDINVLFDYLIGYLFSVVIGHFLIKLFSDTAWTAIGEGFSKESTYHRWTTYILGIIERALFTSSVFFGAREFIAIWLAIKVAAQWKSWEGNPGKVGEARLARARYNLFLLGTGLTVAYSVLGAQITLWLIDNMVFLAIATSIALLLLTVVFWLVAKKNTPPQKKK